MRGRKLTLLVLIFVLSVTDQNKTFAGDFSFNRVEASIHYGFVAPHDDELLHFFKGYFPFYNISVSGITWGTRNWHHIYGYPNIGFDFLYADLAYPEVLGQAYALMPHIKFSLINSQNFRLNLRNGLGLGYLTKKFDRLDNYKNSAISTHLNLAVNIILENEFIIRDKYHITAGIGVTHFSNGRVQIPNKGINIPSLKLGISFGETDIIPGRGEEKNVFDEKRSTGLVIVASGGLSAVYPAGSPKCPRVSLSSMLNQPISQKFNIGIGYDIFYYYNNKHLLSHLDEEDYIPRHFNHGASIGFQMDFSRTAFLIHKGIYFYDKHDQQKSIFYHRAGFRHLIYENFILNLTLKTHFLRAQFIEMGVGYKIF